MFNKMFERQMLGEAKSCELFSFAYFWQVEESLGFVWGG
jgi:hypothetical protein